MMKKGNKALLFVIFSVVIILTIFSFIDSAETINITQTTAVMCINDSKQIMQQMVDDRFNVISINDSIKQAESLFASQVILQEKKRPYNFGLVTSYCDNVQKIRENAIIARDDFDSLLKVYNDSFTSSMNASSVDILIYQIREDIAAERYSEVSALVDKAYSEISRVKSSYTALNLIYRNTTRSLKLFLEKNWKIILSILVILLVLFLIYHIKIAKWIIERKIEKLKIRKNTIKGLIMNVQKDYFQYGKIAEGEYNIKTKKFAELIRDIDRQVPLMQEELAKLNRTRKTR